MPNIWLDSSTPKVSILIHSLLQVVQAKGYSTLVTAKNATQTTDMLDILKVPYHRVGQYGKTSSKR
jgi:predicted glycosyltransferase